MMKLIPFLFLLLSYVQAYVQAQAGQLPEPSNKLGAILGPPLRMTSSDGARVPPLTVIIDGFGAKWGLVDGKVFRNGIDTEGQGSVILHWLGSAYVLGIDGKTWWKWTGLGWENRGDVDPSTIPVPPLSALPPTLNPPLSSPHAPPIGSLKLGWTMPGISKIGEGTFSLYINDKLVDSDIGFACWPSGPDQKGPNLVCNTVVPIRLTFTVPVASTLNPVP